MLEELSCEEIEKLLGPSFAWDPIPRYADERRWLEILDNPLLSDAVKMLRAKAERELGQPLTLVPASLYLTYSRTGSRDPHDGIIHLRRNRLMDFVLCEAMERKGRFMDAIMDHIWAICEETSWVIPAHTRTTLPEFGELPYIDLFSAGTALILAEVAYIMGQRLDDHDPLIRKRIPYEIERRCWRPYLERDDFWWLFGRGRARLNNWTAVCNCGVVGSAILLVQEEARLARMLERCLASMNGYLRSFDPEGGCDEGASYWAYGISHYVWLSYLLEARTERRMSLMEPAEIRKIALFPQRVTLSGQNVANFSDCPPRVAFPPSLLFYMGKRLGMSQVEAFAQHQYDQGTQGACSLMDLVWMPKVRCDHVWEREPHIYFPALQWMVSRADPGDEGSLVLAVKGGNNGENHNQNDVGNFIVHFGGESLIVDLGSGSYTKDYFGPRRYEILVNSSWGHNVPLINDHQQAAGLERAAEVLTHRSSQSGDVLTLELKDAYPPEAGIVSLRRTAALYRSSNLPWIEVTDRVHIAGKSGSYKCPLYTWGEIALRRDGTLGILGERAQLEVKFQPACVSVAIEQVNLGDKKFSKEPRRAVLQMPIQRDFGSLHLEIRPLPGGPG